MTKAEKEVVEVDIFEDDSAIPESNWFEFKNPGDSVSGELLEVFQNESKFGPQHVYIIHTKEGVDVNVGLKDTTHRVTIQKLKQAAIGDTVGFRFKELVDVSKGNMCKSIDIRIRAKVNGEF